MTARSSRRWTERALDARNQPQSSYTIRALLRVAGFEEIRVDVNEASREFIRDWLPGSGVENFVASATIEAVKPGGSKSCCGPSCCTQETST